MIFREKISLVAIHPAARRSGTKGRRTDLKHTFTLVLCVIACIEFRNPAHELPFVDFSLRHSTDEDTTTHHKTWSQSKEAA